LSQKDEAMTASFDVSILKCSFIAKRDEQYNTGGGFIPDSDFRSSNADSDIQ